jgi:hypothetical protein
MLIPSLEQDRLAIIEQRLEALEVDSHAPVDLMPHIRMAIRQMIDAGVFKLVDGQ